MKLHLEALSPVHIGSGTEISPSEYWYDSKSKHVHRLNLESLTRDPAFLPYLEKFVEEAAQARQVERYVPKDILNNHIRYSLPAASSSKYPIKAQLTSGGRVYIPGSSVKGSLLSAILWKELSLRFGRDDGFQGELRQSLRSRDNKESAQRYNSLLGIALGEFCGQADNRFLKWLAVSDTDMRPATGNLAIALVQVVGSKKSQIPVLMEILRPGVTLILQMAQPSGGCLGHRPSLELTEVLETADNFYRRVWQETETAPPPTGGWLLRLGHGSGAWATSFLILTTDLNLRPHYQVNPPMTKKMVDGMTSLGWVRLTELLPTSGEAEQEADETPQEAGPSARLAQLLERLRVTKPQDAGQVGMFLDGIKSLDSEEEKAILAEAISNNFNRKILKKNKRFAELQMALPTPGTDS